jgi:hypothetical protein
MKINNVFAWLKLCAAVFNGAATFLVFYSIFSEGERGVFFSAFSAVLAVVLIDLFYIAALITMEDKSINLRERGIWGISATLLAIATLAIGIADEGILGIVPRIGFVLLVLQDDLAVYSEYAVLYHSRDAQEKRILNKQVLLRKNERAKAFERMIKSTEIQDAMEAKERERELDLLALKSTSFPEPVVHTPTAESYVEEVEPHIMQLATGGYGWVDKFGELNTTTALGKPYSYQGAKAAYSHASKNGKH